MHHLRNRHFLVADILLIPLAVYASFLLRLERPDLAGCWPGFLLISIAATLLTPLLLVQARVYQQYWRYASANDLLVLASRVISAVAIVYTLLFIASRQSPELAVPRSIPLIMLPLTLGAVAGPRLLLRIWSDRTRRSTTAGAPLPVLIMGAGAAGELTVRELQRNPHLNMAIVGLLDDDPHKHGMCIHGVPVIGDRTALPGLVRERGVRQVIIAMPRAPGKDIRAILRVCQEAGVETRTIPGLYELIDGTMGVTQLRTIEIADLLRRAPVETDIAAVRQLIRGQRVMVTGGGGSIGSELCRQVLRCEPAELIILGHGENSVFEIQNELLRMIGDSQGAPHPPRIQAVIADIRDAGRVRAVFERHCPAIVFHAAAHKHVPLMEANPAEAISNNVLGTRNLLEAALMTGVERFVMISSDKAVNPTSVMGASKRVAEMLVHHAAQISGRPYVAVRFGNVLGSRGSVVLTFKRQIAAGGPVTVTHPEMLRYFMTIPEAVQLVLQAAVLGQKGEVFMLDMGDPVKVVDLARDMIRLSGLEVGRDIDIVYTGIRPGEKLYEELFARGESYRPTCHSKVFIADNASSCVPKNLMMLVAELERQAQKNDDAAVRYLLHTLVPEYQSPAVPLAPLPKTTTLPALHVEARTFRPDTPPMVACGD